MRTRIKICGITRRQDMEVAVTAGADAIGLVFVEGSPRRLTSRAAAEIAGSTPVMVTRVGLFMDTEPDALRAVLDSVPLDLLQFHGTETQEECVGYGLPWVKTIAMGGRSVEEAAREADRYPEARAILFDGHAPGEHGGSGRGVDPDRIPGLDRRVIVAGGLRPDNVGAVVRETRPWAVDVSSGVERAPGEKDADKLRRFIEEVGRADAGL